MPDCGFNVHGAALSFNFPQQKHHRQCHYRCRNRLASLARFAALLRRRTPAQKSLLVDGWFFWYFSFCQRSLCFFASRLG